VLGGGKKKKFDDGKNAKGSASEKESNLNDDKGGKARAIFLTVAREKTRQERE
jgi:hypothetical protein